jgi:uncharacterized membrane protein YagU involved in acid resistance
VNFPSILLWGFVATVFLTTLMAAGQGLGLSRMSLPFMLGTVFTADRDRAMVIGFAFHFINGWLFALFYGLIFEDLRFTTWWLGGAIGLAQGLTVLILMMPILPFLHPRMATEHRGPEPTRALEPPGFMAFNYGRQTPAITLVAHVVYGALLGGCYRLAGT